jgi:GMP synthase-like glutamine amidotransferase
MSGKRALVLAHEVDGGGALVSERLFQRGFEVDEHLICPDYTRPDLANPFPATEGYDVLVPMGSIRSLTEKSEIESWIHTEIEIIRETHGRDVPILGVCFGGQLLAEALGGSVEVAPVTEIGWFEIEGDDNPVGPGPWMEWHHDRMTPPPGAEVLAWTNHAIQLIRIGRSVGTQFHPEVDFAHLKSWLDSAHDEYLGDYGLTREQILEDARRHEDHNRDQCFALVDWFLDEVAFPLSPISSE